MKQTRKGNNWHFGMKLHIGTDLRGRVHSVTATHAATGDSTQMPPLLHGRERAFRARGARYRVNRRPPNRHHPLTARWRQINRSRSKVRARGEHPFHVIKRLWGFATVRYRGVKKNLARAQTMFALANLSLVRHRLIPPGARCAL